MLKKLFLFLIIPLVLFSQTREDLYWEIVKEENKIEYYKKYLEKYPDGKFVNKAKKKIKKIYLKEELDLEIIDDSRKTYKKSKLVFVDKGEGLLWQDMENLKKLNFARGSEYCANLRLAGVRGWRLPTLFELQALYEKQNKLRYENLEWFWSSDLKAVNFYSGHTYSKSEYSRNYIRCVKTID